MSRNMQAKILEAIAARAKSMDLELILNPNWANTGLAYIQPTESFKTLTSFHYDFQGDGAIFRFPDHRGEEYAYIHYTDEQYVTKAIDRVFRGLDAEIRS